MTFVELENLLKATIGLDAASVGSGTIERAIRERMKKRSIEEVGTYWEAVSSCAVELQELIETVVIPETWFFRDTRAFEALEKLVREEWLPRHPGDTLRLLSIPCATGEEPYSMAIALHHLGINAQIDGIDISQRVLAMAQAGLYRRNSFRGSELNFRDRFFTADGALYSLNPEIRERVQFENANLLGESFGRDRLKYDYIFCRNLLIYFDSPAQIKAIARLKEMLADDGVIFVGPSESSVMLNQGFASAKVPLAFAFRKQESPPPANTNHRKPTPATVTSKPFALTQPAKPVPVASPKPAPRSLPPPNAPKKDNDTLKLAGILADEGKLEEAAAICRTHIHDHGPSPQAFYLLGLVQDASDQPEQAREFYRKAIYMQPNHYEALVHLALLAKSQGDETSARLLQERAERAKQLINQ